MLTMKSWHNTRRELGHQNAHESLRWYPDRAKKSKKVLSVYMHHGRIIRTCRDSPQTFFSAYMHYNRDVGGLDRTIRARIGPGCHLFTQDPIYRRKYKQGASYEAIYLFDLQMQCSNLTSRMNKAVHFQITCCFKFQTPNMDIARGRFQYAFMF